jgi:hypothetical protein
VGVMIGILIFLGSIITATLSIVVANDITVWVPLIVEYLIRRAIKNLPREIQDRLDEEWHGHIAEIPGNLGKLCIAVGFVVASNRVLRARHQESTIRRREDQFSSKATPKQSAESASIDFKYIDDWVTVRLPGKIPSAEDIRKNAERLKQAWEDIELYSEGE